MTADGEGLLFGARGFKADSGWRSLPDGHGAGGVQASVFGQDSQKRFLQHRLFAVQLGYDRERLLPIVGNATVGNLIAMPARRRIHRVKLRQVYRRDASRQPVDHQPAAALPLPLRCRILRESIIYPKYAAHYKQSFRNLVRRSQHVLPHSAIYHQCADIDAHLLVISVRTDHPLHRLPFSEGDDVRFCGSER
jgi:hypothetical protein